ncbi:unnamed protein product [Calypogeia fissa]
MSFLCNPSIEAHRSPPNDSAVEPSFFCGNGGKRGFSLCYTHFGVLVNGISVDSAGQWRGNVAHSLSRTKSDPNHSRKFGGLTSSPFRGFWCFADYVPAKDSRNGRNTSEKFEFDNIQDLIVSPPSVPSTKTVSDQPPTLLEREAEALEGSAIFSRQERIEAMSGLLDHLEQKGVTPGYAFEFVRYAGGLIDDLYLEAQEMLVQDVLPLDKMDLEGAEGDRAAGTTRPPWPSVRHSYGDSAADIEREKKINKLLEISADGAEPEMHDEKSILWHEINTLASRVTDCAEKRELGRLVSYFQIIGMKAQNVPRMLPFLEQGIDMAMAKVEFLRSLGVKYNHLPVILERWPELLSYQCDSLAHNVDYLVGLGVAHKDVGKMVIKFPQILGRHVEKELQNSVTVLENLGVHIKDVKKLVVRYPILLTENASDKLDPVVTYLEQLGVQKKHIGTLLLRRPLLLDSDVERDLAPIGNYLKTLNASADDIEKILMSFPQLFSYSVEQDFRPTVHFLESLGVDSGLIGKLFRRHPQLLKNRHSFELKLEFLLSLGLEQNDLGKVIYNAPQLLGLSVADNLQPTIKFLESIGITGSSLLKILKLKPMVLAYSIEGKLKSNIKFFENLQIKEEALAKLVTRHPQLLTLSVEKNLEPTVSYLVNLGFTRDEITAMVKKLPSLLGFRVETVLAPKYAYLVDVMKRSRADVVQFPHYFSYSLQNRIIFRHQFLGQLCETLSLNTLYGCSDAVFERKAKKWPQRMFHRKELDQTVK